MTSFQKQTSLVVLVALITLIAAVVVLSPTRLKVVCYDRARIVSRWVQQMSPHKTLSDSALKARADLFAKRLAEVISSYPAAHHVTLVEAHEALSTTPDVTDALMRELAAALRHQERTR